MKQIRDMTLGEIERELFNYRTIGVDIELFKDMISSLRSISSAESSILGIINQMEEKIKEIESKISNKKL